MAHITCTNAELWAAGTSQNNQPPVLTTVGGWVLPVKTAYAFTKIRRKAGEALRDLEEVRLALLVKHAEKDEHGKPKTIDHGNGKMEYVVPDMAAYAAEFSEVLKESVTLTGCWKVKLEDFGPDCSPTPGQLEVLEPFIEAGE